MCLSAESSLDEQTWEPGQAWASNILALNVSLWDESYDSYEKKNDFSCGGIPAAVGFHRPFCRKVVERDTPKPSGT